MKARGLKLGLATNDTEMPARLHLERAGVLDLFDYVVGCDSGWGGKPAPGQLLEFLRRFDLTPSRVAMVGDSRHDLDAGRAAGMHAVAVLTGMAGHDDLVGHADVVLDDIAALDGWIGHLGTIRGLIEGKNDQIGSGTECAPPDGFGHLWGWVVPTSCHINGAVNER